METRDRSRLLNMGMVPFKVALPLTAATAAAVSYHYKPSIPCKLIDAKLMIVAAPDDTATILITKDTIAALDTPTDKLITGATGVDVATSALFSIVTGEVASVAVNGSPGANYKTAQVIDVGSREAVQIALPVNSDPLEATLILEFLPV